MILKRILGLQAQKARRAIGGLFEDEPPPKWPVQTYPLGLRPNALVSIDPTPFILAQGGLEIECPYGTWIVVAIGTASDRDMQEHRFYMEGVEDKDKELMLQIKKKGDLLETVVFTANEEVFPSESEWGFWLNNVNGLIGFRDFSIKEQKTDPETSQPYWIDRITYARSMRNPGPDWIEPVVIRERVYTEGGSTSVTHHAMEYARVVTQEGGDEALACTEVLHVSQERDEEGDYISISTGLRIEPTSITVN